MQGGCIISFNLFANAADCKNKKMVKVRTKSALKEKIESKIKEELESGSEISIINLVDSLVEFASQMGASDIHIDPREGDVRVRLRIDGVLQDAFTFPGTIHAGIISRIKIIAGLRTDEHQTPQDGRFRTMFEDSVVDVRVSIVPTYHGENAVLRLLADKAEEFSLETLGFSREDQKKIENAIKKPFGMILVTGPTGSGKTTTLYTILKELNKPEVSIITVEDPIEYAMEGVEQIQVNSRANLTFANGLRSVLRQDPDIIMVGEIRDSETAGLAVNTALTGHLLLSTLHTNDAATVLPRLLDMGVEPYLVSSTVNIVIAQRLVRRICENCKTKKKLNDAEKKSLRDVFPEDILGKHDTFFYGKGCDKCSGSGYKGRISINEVIVIDDKVREAFLRKDQSSEIKKIAIESGMTPVIKNGFDKAVEGTTTIEEILRVTHE